MSYVVEVKESANSAWIANGVRFATAEEAEFAKDDLAGRWFGPVGFRTAESDKPANYRWENGESTPIPGTMADNAQRPTA